MKIRDMSKEVLQECKRMRPLEFKHVNERQVGQVLMILYRNISFIMLNNGLLAIKDYLLFRPNTSKLAKRRFYAEKKRAFAEVKRLRYLNGERAAHRLYEKDGVNPLSWKKNTDSVFVPGMLDNLHQAGGQEDHDEHL